MKRSIQDRIQSCRSRRLASTASAAVPCLLAFGLYFRCFGYAFVYDDGIQIVKNPWLGSWHYLPRYFTGSVWGFVNGVGASPYWRPLFLVWLRANFVLFGTAPAGWHVTTVLVHVLNVALVYAVARYFRAGTFAAMAAAAIFAVHPIAIESVAWVSGVTDPLCASGLLAALLLWLASRKRHEQTAALRLASIACFIFALLTKETAVVFPAVVFTYAFLADDDSIGGGPTRVQAAVRAGAPYAIVLPFYALLRTLAVPTTSTTRSVSWLTTVLSVPSLLGFYAGKLILPIGLSISYDVKAVTTFTIHGVLVPLIGVAAAIAAWQFLWKRAPFGWPIRFVAFSLVWMLVTLAPALYIRALSPDDIAHTRYLYLPSIGFAWIAGVVLSAWRSNGRRLSRQLAPAALAILVMLFSAMNWTQQQYWSDGITLFQRAVQIAPSSPMPYKGLGVEYSNSGLMPDAIQQFEKAAAIDPDNEDTNRNLGAAYILNGRSDIGERYLKRATDLGSKEPEVFLFLAVAQLKQNKLEEAERSIRQAIQFFPEGTGYQFTLGEILQLRGDRDGAVAAFRRELVNRPGNAESISRLRTLGVTP